MKKIIIVFVLFFTLLGQSAPVFAAGSLNDAGKKLSEIGVKSGAVDESKAGEVNALGDVVGTIINAALSLVGIIFLILMVYSGFLWMTARGDDSQIDKAKKIISGTVIGLVIVLSAYAITVLVTENFSATSQEESANNSCASLAASLGRVDAASYACTGSANCQPGTVAAGNVCTIAQQSCCLPN